MDFGLWGAGGKKVKSKKAKVKSKNAFYLCRGSRRSELF
jgi:hypothetical protein